MFELSVIIPIRTDSFDFYRQRLILRDNLELRGVETIVVDDGSPESSARDIEDFCQKRSYRYLRIPSEKMGFSLARSRNVGMRVASSPFVYMEDADLVYPANFFQDLICQLRLLEQTPFNFLSVPAVYLTEQASARVYADGCLDGCYRRLVNSLLLEDPKGSPGNAAIESYAPASGVIALRRDLALSLGGYDEAFSGWGGEDRDFIFRLLCANEKIQLPQDFAETKSWNLNDTVVYEGWRALHRLHGEFMARQGFYAVHLHHEKLAWRGDVSSAQNMKLAANKALGFKFNEVSSYNRFDVKYTVLFDIFRCYDVMSFDGGADYFLEKMSRANKSRDKAQGKTRRFHRKLRKLFISPLQFFEDSGSPLLIRLAKYFRNR